MKVVFFGTPHYVIPILETLQSKFTVVGIVTAPDKKAGRKQLITPSPVKQYFLDSMYKNEPTPENRIFTPEQFDNETIKQLHALQPDLFIVAAYGKLIPNELLTIPPFGSVCVHPSLLPKYRGPSPIQQTLLDGEKITGVTIIKMDKELDHGPIIDSAPFEVHETDTFETLMQHLFNLSKEMLPDLIKNYVQGKIVPQPQDDTKATFTKKITKEDGSIDINNPPDKEKIARMIRAYYPWPGVWCKFKVKSEKLKVIKFLPNNMVQIEGKKPVSYKNFLNGYPELKEKLDKILAM